MKGAAVVVASALLATAPACTLVGLGVGSSVVGTHNAFTDDQNDWHYATPMWIGAGIGLACDIVFILLMKSQWDKPLT
ncbi:MAG TPA: hypothetical protein VLB44_09250 [Kofleriaceae bacterium]|nr:hypothetical protein [Kofleriaceae bacterium]